MRLPEKEGVTMKKTVLFLILLMVLALVATVACAQSLTPEQETFCASLTGYLNDVMHEIGKAADDPLTAAICSGGVSKLTISPKYEVSSNQPVKATLYIKSMNPQSAPLPKYDRDPFGYWKKIMQAITGHTYKVSLTVLAEDGRFSLADKQRLSLESAIFKAADKARKGIGSTSLVVPLTELIAPMPVQVKSNTKTIEEDDYSALFVSFAGHNPMDYSREAMACAVLLLKGGTVTFGASFDALQVTLNVPASMEDFMLKAVAGVMKDLKRDAQARNYSDEALKKRLIDNLESLALAYRKDKKAATQEYHFTLPFTGEYGIDTWYQPSEEYLNSFFGSLEQAMEEMKLQISDLPDYPAMDEPKTGRLSGSKSGTQVVLKIPKDGYARYVEFRNSADQKELSCYIRAGSTARVRLSQGGYYLVIGAGDTWYGTGHLFGESASYSKTDYFQVPSSSWIYTLTLEPVTNLDDGIPIYDIDLNDLLNGG